MFGLGIWEIALIAVVALLVLGPEKLPDAAKSLGKALRDFRRAGDDIKREMMGEMDDHPRPPLPMTPRLPEGSVPQEQPKAAPETPAPPDSDKPA